MLPTQPLFSIPFVSATWPQVDAHIEDVIQQKQQELWVTANPEIVERAHGLTGLLADLQKKAVVFPDGIGIILASRLLGKALPQRLSGVDMISHFKGHSLFLLGSKASIVTKAAEELVKQGHTVVGHAHGYFDADEEAHIMQKIKDLRPQILLIGLGMGRQEQWLFKNVPGLPVNIAVTVGGSFDVISGIKKRAPEVLQQVHLEWLYRLTQEPQRIFRQLVLLKFCGRVFIRFLNKIRYNFANDRYRHH